MKIAAHQPQVDDHTFDSRGDANDEEEQHSHINKPMRITSLYPTQPALALALDGGVVSCIVYESPVIRFSSASSISSSVDSVSFVCALMSSAQGGGGEDDDGCFVIVTVVASFSESICSPSVHPTDRPSVRAWRTAALPGRSFGICLKW